MGTKRTIAELVTLARRSQGDELRAALRGSSDTKLDTLAEELEEKKLFPAAEVVRRELIDRQPRDPSRWLTLGYNVYYLQRQAERADELFTEALRKVPGNVDLIAMRGLNLSWALHRYAEARPLFERALKANPGDAVTRVNLASCFVGLGKADEALTHTNRAADDAENEEDDEHRNAIPGTLLPRRTQRCTSASQPSYSPLRPRVRFSITRRVFPIASSEGTTSCCASTSQFLPSAPRRSSVSKPSPRSSLATSAAAPLAGKYR